jgi:molybdopterin converting factor subunit 1
MTVRVLLFASYADAIGAATLNVEVGESARVRDVLAAVQARAASSTLPPRPLVAVNSEYAELDQLVVAGDEVAIIPPVAGG